MKVAVILARLLFGGVFLFFGLNFFFQFVAQPEHPPEAQEFWSGLMASGYFMPLLKWTEVICGGLILAGVFVPLALVVITPVVLHILAYHLFFDSTGLPIAGAVLALELFLVYAYRKHFLCVLNPFAHPSVVKRIDG